MTNAAFAATNIETNRAGWAMPARLLAVYLATVAVLVWVAAHGSAGFSYSLDDPYIHLALAQHLRYGLYGLNAGEVSSPASSVLWPFLLVPSAVDRFASWAPLVLNLVCGGGVCLVVGAFVERWVPSRRGDLFAEAGRWLLAVLCVFAGNLPALTLMGMEHVLQALLVAACAWGLAEAAAGRSMPPWALAAAVLAPAVRYEDLAFTLAVTLALWWRGRRGVAALVLGLSVVPLFALGLFLHGHGLGWLPNSVVVKGGVVSARPHWFPQAPLLDHMLTLVAVNLRGYVLSPDYWPITLAALVLGWQVARRGLRSQDGRVLLAGLLGLLLLMVIGPYGYAHRYESVYRLFGFLLVVVALSGMRTPRLVAAYASASIAASVALATTPHVPLACWQVAHEQKQMHRFADDYLQADVAVNDLGWVSFDSGSRFRILDLAGLASNDAAFQRHKDAAWLDAITARHRVGTAMIYRYWFESIPTDWTLVAELHRGGGGPDVVAVYATGVGDAAQLRGTLERFAPTLPAGSWLVFPGR